MRPEDRCRWRVRCSCSCSLSHAVALADLVTADGADKKTTLSPSAIVGCVSAASRPFLYGSSASMAICTTGLTYLQPASGANRPWHPRDRNKNSSRWRTLVNFPRAEPRTVYRADSAALETSANGAHSCDPIQARSVAVIRKRQPEQDVQPPSAKYFVFIPLILAGQPSFQDCLAPVLDRAHA
jgi:hypothetical protein